MITAVLAVAAALLLSLLLPFALIPLLKRHGVLDVPNERSSHTRAVVRGVGITVAVGLLAGLLIAGLGGAAEAPQLLLAVAVVAAAAALLGWVEDFRGLSIRGRAALQLGIGAGGTALAIELTGQTWWWLPLGALALAAYINIANFMDGVNGISGLHGTAVGLMFAATGAVTGHGWLVVGGAVVAAAFVAFLPWNLGRGNVFLGDVGSYLLGASLAMLGMTAFLDGVPAEYLLGPVAIYLADTLATLLRRISAGERWYAPHRTHAYQRLTDVGFSHLQSALLVTGCSLLTGLCGYLAAEADLMGKAAAIVAGAAVVVFYLRSPVVFSRRSSNAAGPAA
ncbi:MAG TPA: UDP-phosphate glycosyltransferase [Arthrobacter sp.]|nr:UDP-phosphate glycosyltransferase [Arthrobacter sp.]